MALGIGEALVRMQRALAEPPTPPTIYKRDELILKLYDEGDGVVALAEYFGMTPPQMSEFLRKNNRVVHKGRRKVS